MISNRKWKYTLIAAGLVFLDVLIKIIIDSSFMDEKMIINKYLGFSPKLNTDQLSVFNNELGLGISLVALVILNLVLLVTFVFIANWMKRKFREEKFIGYTIICLYAGLICSLIDKVFWGGSLDYLLIFDQIVDLKDIYLVFAICFYFIAAAKEMAYNKKTGDK